MHFMRKNSKIKNIHRDENNESLCYEKYLNKGRLLVKKSNAAYI